MKAKLLTHEQMRLVLWRWKKRERERERKKRKAYHTVVGSCRSGISGVPTGRKNLDAVGIEPTTFHRLII
jgi:hypothetical protein